MWNQYVEIFVDGLLVLPDKAWLALDSVSVSEPLAEIGNSRTVSF